MEITEERVREIAREEVVFAGMRERWGCESETFEPSPPLMSRIEALNLRSMGLDPFREAEKPKPDWMSYVEAAELRAAGIDPEGVTREAIRGKRAC